MLVDTHVLLWLVLDDPRLGKASRGLLSASVARYFSAASVFEMTIKAMKGQLSFPADVAIRLTSEGLAELPITGAHAQAVEEFPELEGHDPFDRLLVAQAKAEGLRFITADRRLLDLGHEWIIDARS